MILGDPTYTPTAESDLRSLGKAAAWFVVTWLRQWARGEVGGRPVPLSYTDPDPRYVVLPGGLAAPFTTKRSGNPERPSRAFPAPLIVCILPERELAERREEILKAILQADDEA